MVARPLQLKTLAAWVLVLVIVTCESNAAPSPYRRLAKEGPVPEPSLSPTPYTLVRRKHNNTDPEAVKISPTPTSRSRLNYLESCFPSVSTVELRSGNHIHMSELKIGDVVRVSPTEFSEVFTFSHRTDDAFTRFVSISLSTTNVSLLVSPGHFVYRSDGALVTADALTAGEYLIRADGTYAVIKSISETLETGLYNPQTLQGDIVVDEILFSTYTRAIDPTIAGNLLVIPKFWYQVFGVDPLMGLLNSGNPKFREVVASVFGRE